MLSINRDGGNSARLRRNLTIVQHGTKFVETFFDELAYLIAAAGEGVRSGLCVCSQIPNR
jgi:hypothetical protein